MTRPGKHPRGTGQLRIIGGKWRGRRLLFTPAAGLRPTADRIRETLFNWLAAHVDGARCADLFAGSGALGLEALSRGAAHCDFVDTSRPGLDAIAAHLERLDAGSAGRCHHTAADRFLRDADTPWQLVFIDPPFDCGLAAPVVELLAQRQLVAPGALVYLETGSREVAPPLPDNWDVHREKTAGDVTYRLLRVAV